MICNLDGPIVRMKNIESENFIFILFQIFQMWFCFNAVYNQNTNHVVIITVINFVCALYGIASIFFLKKEMREDQEIIYYNFSQFFDFICRIGSMARSEKMVQ